MYDISDLNSAYSTTNPEEELDTKCQRAEHCEECGEIIQDRYILRLANTSYHEKCVECNVCKVKLHNKCYARKGKLYCKQDYERIFSVHCTRCSDRIFSHDMVMKIHQQVYHLSCFSCSVCFHKFDRGDQCFLSSGNLLCILHYDPAMTHTSTLYDGSSESLNGDMDDEHGDSMCHYRSKDGRKGPKRPRTILTSAQRRRFKASFELSSKPCRKSRETLARESGLSVRVVQVWFQNQRAKMKKIYRKGKNSGAAESDESKIDTNAADTPERSKFTKTSSIYDGNSSIAEGFPDDDDASFSSTEMSIDTNAFEDNAVEHGSNLQLHTAPIDKLYLMHGSYFND